jgi:hypothetical protein
VGNAVGAGDSENQGKNGSAAGHDQTIEKKPQDLRIRKNTRPDTPINVLRKHPWGIGIDFGQRLQGGADHPENWNQEDA